METSEKNDPYWPLKSLVFCLMGALSGYLAYLQKMGEPVAWIVGISVAGVGIYASAKLGKVRAELWITFGLKFLIAVAYKLMTFAFTLYLLKDLKVADGKEQIIYGAWGVWMSICTLCSGSITDTLGLRKTLLIGILICILSRIVMVSSDNLYLVICCGVIPVAIGEALCTPVLVAATRQFTSSTQRSVAFSVMYALLNMGFMFAYFIGDGVKTSAVNDVWHIANINISPYRALFLLGVGFELIALPCVWFMRDGHVARNVVEKGKNWLHTLKYSFSEMVNMFAKMFTNKVFHKLLYFLLLIGLLKIVFGLMDAVNPIFAERVMGKEAAKSIGRLNAVNSIVIMILAPAIGVWTRRYAAYPMVIWGGLFTAASFIFLSLPTNLFIGLADGPIGNWFGHEYLNLKGAVHPYWMMMLLWMIIFSIGEAIYSPRVAEYAVAIAPPGQEASYASLSTLPMLMSKMLGASVTAILVPMFIPAQGDINAAAMWMGVGALIGLSPLLLLIFRKNLSAQEEGRE